MWDIQTAITGALHRAKDSSSGRGSMKTDVEVRLKRASSFSVVLALLSNLVLTVDLGHTLKGLIEAELDEGAARKEEAGGVCGTPV